MFTILMDRFEPLHIKVVGIGLLASILYDILWMKQYHVKKNLIRLVMVV